MQRAYHGSTRVFGALILVLGVGMAIAAIVRGGGPMSLGVVLGVLFAVLGAGRLYLATAASRPER